MPYATFEIKRRVLEQLVKEVRIGRTEDGTPLVTIVYWFSKDLLEANSDVRLYSTRMSLQNVITTIEREIMLVK